MKSGKLKSTATDIIAVVGAIIGVLPGLFHKKPYVLWYLKPAGWTAIGTFSARQCRKQMAELVGIGYDPDKFVILRKGVTPEVPK